MSVMVIACYRPKSGKEEALLKLMKTHLPTLRAEGLVGDGPSLAGRAKDGTIVEVFTWKSQGAIDAAHENKAIAAMWAAYAEICDYVAIKDVAGAGDLFTPLEPLAFD
ncbi:MAG: hypothetical protein AAFW81_07855 [Pseudomonadota bacterium]